MLVLFAWQWYGIGIIFPPNKTYEKNIYLTTISFSSIKGSVGLESA